MPARTTAAVLLGMLSFCASGANAAPPVLNTSSGDLTVAPGVSPGPQAINYGATERGTTLDGALMSAPAFDWALGADPTAVDISGSRLLGPVDLVTGRLRYHELQLLLPALAPWPIGISYSGDSNADGYQGKGWFQSAQPCIKFDNRGNGDDTDDLVYLIYAADGYAQFKRVSTGASEFVGINGAAGVIKITTDGSGYELYTYYDPTGTTTVFFGFNGYSASPKQGQIWKYSTGTGSGVSTAYVGHATAVGTALGGYNADGSISQAFDSAGRRFDFTYTSAGGTSRLTKVEAKLVGSSSTMTIAEVDYTYYGLTPTTTTAFGSAGALSGVSVKLSPGGTLEQTRSNAFYYEAASGGQPERLKMVLGYEGRRRSATPFPSTWTDVTNDLKPRAEIMVEYTSGKVSSLRLAGMTGTGISGERVQPSGLYTITYDTVPAGTLTAPASRAVITFPSIDRLVGTTASTGSAYATHYFNTAYEALSTVTHDANPTASGVHNWVTGIVRDSDGRLQSIHTPANCSAYTHDVSGSPSGAYTKSTTAGLVTYLQRITTSTDPLKGFVKAVRRGPGTGAATYVSSTDYITQSVTIGSATLYRPLVNKTQAYHTGVTSIPTSGMFDETTFTHTFWSGSLVRKSVTTTNPVVTSGQNGSGSATTSSQYFDERGQRRFTVVENGRVSYFEYDAGSGTDNTGLLKKEIADAQTSGTAISTLASSFGVATANIGDELAATAYDRVTQYQRDTLGRVIRTNDPAGRDSLTVYTALADQRAVRLEVPFKSAAGEYFGPVSFSVTNHSGTAEESGLIQPGTTQIEYNSVFTGTSPKSKGLYYSTTDPTAWISTSQSDIRSALASGGSGATVVSYAVARMSSDGSRLEESRWYHTIPASGAGARDTNYDRSLMNYNGLGQVTHTVDQTDTMHQVKIDALGRSVGVWKGIYNTSSGASFSYASQGSGIATSKRISGTEYDGGASNVGNGHVTKSRSYPDGDASGAPAPYETRYGYDTFDRLVATAGSAAPYASWKLDNLGRPLNLGMFDTDSSFNFSSGSFPDPAPTSWATSQVGRQDFSWDSNGRMYRDSNWGVDTSTPGSSTADPQPLDTDHYYGKMGLEVATVGETVVKRKNNRTCELSMVGVCANAPSSGAYTDASAVNNKDVVLTQTVMARNTQTGTVVVVASAERPTRGMTSGASECACTGGLIRMASGTTVPSSGGTFRFAYDTTTAALQMDAPTGPVRLQIYIPRPEDDRPMRIFDWGDLHEQPAVTSPICCAATCSTPDPAPANLPHWATETETNPLDIMVRSVSAERTSGADSGYRTTVVSTTDAMGRPLTRQKTIDKPADYPSDFPGSSGPACCTSETETNTWYRGRMTDMGLAIPSASCVQHTQTGYPDTVPKIPPAFGWDTEPQYDNNRPLWQSRPGPAITTFTPMPPNMRKVYRRNPLGELQEYYEPHLLDQPFATSPSSANPIHIERDAGGRPTGIYEPRPIPFNGTMWRTGIEYDGAGRPNVLTKGAGPIGDWYPPHYTTTERLTMQHGPWGLKQLDQQSMANCSGGGPVWSQQFTSALPFSSGSGWQSAATGCSSAQPGWRGPYENARTLPGGITLNAQYDDYSSTARPTTGVELGVDALIHRPTGQSFDLGSVTGTPLGSYASAGLARPHYRSTAGSGIESYTWTPTGAWGRSAGPFDTSGGTSFKVNPDWRGRTRGMAWTLAMDISGSRPDSANAIFGYQLEWKDRTVAQAWDFVRTPYPYPAGSSTPPAPVTPFKNDWSSHFGTYDGPGTHEFAQAGCKDEPLIWTRALSPSQTVTGSGAPSGGLMPALRATMAGAWGSTSGSNTYASPGMGPMEMNGRDCRGNPGALLDDRDGSWNSAWAKDPASIDEVFVQPAPKVCEDDAADQVDSWFGGVHTNSAAQAVKHDSSGHLTDDGYKFRYRYDASGRLTDVHKRSVSGSTVTDGAPVAHYGYNAAGWRTRADYDSDGDGAIAAGDVREYYQYDEQWRLTGIYRTPVPTGEDPDMACPGESTPCLYQVYGYPPSGRTGGGGFPVAMGNPDTANSRWRDTDCDGSLDERLDILGDAGGNVRAVMLPGSGGGEGGAPLSEFGLTLERYDYTPFGRPIAQPVGDLNGDGVVNSDDGNAHGAAQTAWGSNNADYDPRADLDHDGDIDGTDYSIWKTTPRVGWADLDGYADGKDHLSYGDGFAKNVGLDMRIGYRGYVWDPKLGMYHVRNRVYDPVAQRFIQPDPIGDAGGDHNWYRYVQNQPWAEYDPMGLWDWDGGWIQYGVGGLLGFHGSQVAGDGWSEGARGGAATVRGVGHAASELYLTAQDVVVGSVNLNYQYRSQMMSGYEHSDNAFKDGMRNAGDVVLSGASLGTYDIAAGSIEFLHTGDTNALGMRMGGVIFQNVMIVVGAEGTKFVKDASGKIIARISEDGKVEAVGDGGAVAPPAPEPTSCPSDLAGPEPSPLNQTITGPEPAPLSQRISGSGLEQRTATITGSDIGTGTPTNAASRQLARSLGLSTDDAGHWRARGLGGPGDDIFPQSPNINRGAFRAFEQQIARQVRLGPDAVIDVRGHYQTGSTRPFAITYRVTINGQVIERTFSNP